MSCQKQWSGVTYKHKCKCLPDTKYHIGQKKCLYSHEWDALKKEKDAINAMTQKSGSICTQLCNKAEQQASQRDVEKLFSEVAHKRWDVAVWKFYRSKMALGFKRECATLLVTTLTRDYPPKGDPPKGLWPKVILEQEKEGNLTWREMRRRDFQKSMAKRLLCEQCRATQSYMEKDEAKKKEVWEKCSIQQQSLHYSNVLHQMMPPDYSSVNVFEALEMGEKKIVFSSMIKKEIEKAEAEAWDKIVNKVPRIEGRIEAGFGWGGQWLFGGSRKDKRLKLEVLQTLSIKEWERSFVTEHYLPELNSGKLIRGKPQYAPQYMFEDNVRDRTKAMDHMKRWFAGLSYAKKQEVLKFRVNKEWEPAYGYYNAPDYKGFNINYPPYYGKGIPHWDYMTKREMLHELERIIEKRDKWEEMGRKWDRNDHPDECYESGTDACWSKPEWR